MWAVFWQEKELESGQVCVVTFISYCAEEHSIEVVDKSELITKDGTTYIRLAIYLDTNVTRAALEKWELYTQKVKAVNEATRKRKEREEQQISSDCKRLKEEDNTSHERYSNEEGIYDIYDTVGAVVIDAEGNKQVCTLN